jgi:hypothetical protein
MGSGTEAEIERMNEVEDRASCGEAPRSKQTKENAFGRGNFYAMSICCSKGQHHRSYYLFKTSKSRYRAEEDSLSDNSKKLRKKVLQSKRITVTFRYIG